MKQLFRKLVFLICLFFLSIFCISQDYIFENNGDTLHGYIRDFGMKKLQLQVKENKRIKFDVNNVDEFFYEIKSQVYKNRSVTNRKKKIFLPAPDREHFLASYSGDDNVIHVTRMDTITLYRIFLSDGRPISGTIEGHDDRTFYYSQVYIYVESPFNGLAALYEPVMTDAEYEDTFLQFKKYFSGKRSVIEKVLHARNTNLRKTQTYAFTNEVLEDFFGKENMARIR